MVFNKFFTHSDIGIKWWNPAKFILIISTILLLIMTGINMYNEYKNQKNVTFELWIPSIVILIFIFYISTLTASCLKVSKCSILAFFHLLSPLIGLIILGIIIWAKNKGLINQIKSN